MKLLTAKRLAFLGQTLMGCLLLLLAYFLQQNNVDDDPTRLISSWFLVITGLGCLLFGIATFFLRQEPDIWS